MLPELSNEPNLQRYLSSSDDIFSLGLYTIRRLTSARPVTPSTLFGMFKQFGLRMEAIVFNTHCSTFNMSPLNSVFQEVLSRRRKTTQGFCSWNLGRRVTAHRGTARQTMEGGGHRKLLKPNKPIIVIPIISLQLTIEGHKRVAPGKAPQSWESPGTKSISKRRQNPRNTPRTLKPCYSDRCSAPPDTV